MMTAEDRPDMSYSKIRAKRDGQGIACPECGCRDLIVTNTRRIVDFIRRLRRCRNCGYGPILTLESAPRFHRR